MILEIEGVGRVRVDPSFMGLSPEDQGRTVDEISTQFRHMRTRAASGLPGWGEAVGRGFAEGAIGSFGGAAEGIGHLGRMAGAEGMGSALQQAGRGISEFGHSVGPDEAYRGLATDIAGGVGSMGTYLIPGGAAARAVGTAGNLARGAAGIGAASTMAGPSGVAEAYNRAIQSGLSDEEALERSLPGFGAGVVQVAPVALLLRTIPVPVRGQALAQARHIAEAALGEFAAEGTGAVLQNLIQQSYDPERGAWDDSLYRAAIGGSSGALLQLGISAATRGRGPFAGRAQAPQMQAEPAPALPQKAAGLEAPRPVPEIPVTREMATEGVLSGMERDIGQEAILSAPMHAQHQAEAQIVGEPGMWTPQPFIPEPPPIPPRPEPRLAPIEPDIAPHGEPTAPPVAPRQPPRRLRKTPHPLGFPDWPVLTMLKRGGGVNPGSFLAGELRHMGITPRTAPGLFKHGGRGDVDNFVIEEHGVFEHLPDTDGTGYVPRDVVLEAIRDEFNGAPWRTAEQARQEAELEIEERNREHAELEVERDEMLRDDIAEVLREIYEIDSDPALIDRTMAVLAESSPATTIDEAVERALILLAEGEVSDANKEWAFRETGIPFPDTRAIPEAGEGVAEAGVFGEGQRAAGGLVQDRPAVSWGRADEGAPRQALIEPGAEGLPQTILPGAERITDAHLAQRRADQPLQPRVAQRPMETGLFGDESRQIDLVDQARRPAGLFSDLPARLAETRFVDRPAVQGPDGRAYRVKKEGDGYIALRMSGGLLGGPPTYFRPPKGKAWTLDEAIQHVVGVWSQPQGRAQ